MERNASRGIVSAPLDLLNPLRRDDRTRISSHAIDRIAPNSDVVSFIEDEFKTIVDRFNSHHTLALDAISARDNIVRIFN